MILEGAMAPSLDRQSRIEPPIPPCCARGPNPACIPPERFPTLFSQICCELSATLTRLETSRPTFQRLFQDQLGYVLRTLERLGVPRRNAEDAAQEVFVAVHKKLSDYDPARPLRPWLFAFCYHVAQNEKRRAVHRDVLTESPIGESERTERISENPEERELDREGRLRVLRALEKLPAEQRAALILCDIDGHSAREAALALGEKEATIYSRIRLGRAAFKTAYKNEMAANEKGSDAHV